MALPSDAAAAGRAFRLRVATKFALAYLACSALALTAYAVSVAEREASELREAATTDLLGLGHYLSPLLAEVWQREGEGRARELVAHGAVGRGDVVVEFGPPLPSGAPYQAWVEPRGGMERVVVRLEVEAAPASLELGRLVPAKGALLRQELGRELWAVGLVALLSAFLARAMGHWLIGGPLGRIADQVQRLGAGDLSRRLVPRGSREIYDLKVAINHTSDELAAARERASREKALREEAVAQLRHADRMRTVGTLAAGIAHELGTPLNVILLRAHMIARGELEGDDVKTSAATIAGQTERLTRIVRQLLDFARRKNPSRSPVDLRELALRTAALLGPLAAKRDVHLTVAGEQPVRAEVDGGQIEQALTNLVMNAVHASPRGAVVTLRAGFDGQEAILAVEDEGCGMAPEVLERVFEPFFTTKEPGEGTGLGLSVAFGIASDHGGRLDAASVPGRGSTFTLRLPTEQPTS